MVSLIVSCTPPAFYQPFGCRCLLMHKLQPQKHGLIIGSKFSVLTIALMEFIFHLWEGKIKKRLKISPFRRIFS